MTLRPMTAPAVELPAAAGGEGCAGAGEGCRPHEAVESVKPGPVTTSEYAWGPSATALPRTVTA